MRHSRLSCSHGHFERVFAAQKVNKLTLSSKQETFFLILIVYGLGTRILMSENTALAKSVTRNSNQNRTIKLIWRYMTIFAKKLNVQCAISQLSLPTQCNTTNEWSMLPVTVSSQKDTSITTATKSSPDRSSSPNTSERCTWIVMSASTERPEESM